MTAVLYGAKGQAATTSNLYTLDPATAAATSIGATGHAFTSLAFDPTNGTLYGTTSANSSTNDGSLFTLDPATGASTLVGAMGGTTSDIAFDTTGQLWGWTRKTSAGGLGGTNSALLQIDKTDASFSVIGTSGQDIFGGGISFHSDGTLYGLLPISSAAYVHTIDTGTGAISVVGFPTPGLTIISAAAFDANDKLYTLVGGGGIHHMYWVDVVGLTVTNVGDPGTNFDALAWTVTVATQALEGVCIAFDDAALNANPVWTRIDL